MQNYKGTQNGVFDTRVVNDASRAMQYKIINFVINKIVINQNNVNYYHWKNSSICVKRFYRTKSTQSMHKDRLQNCAPNQFE